MKNRLSLAFMLLAILSGCAAGIITFTDRDSRATITRMKSNRLKGGIASVELNAQRFDKGEKPSYSLIVVYKGPFFIYIEPGKSLVLIIDEDRLEIPSSGFMSEQTVVSIGLVEEKMFYHDLDPGIFQRLGCARNVVVMIHGRDGVIERHFNKKNTEAFRQFYELHVKDYLSQENVGLEPTWR